MITLEDWLTAVNYKITEGGPRAATDGHWWLSSDDHMGEIYSIYIIFDTVSRRVLQALAHDIKAGRCWRITDEDFNSTWRGEAATFGVDPDHAPDGSEYVDLECDRDWIEKASAIAKGLPYDHRVLIELDLTEQEQQLLQQAANVSGLSIDQFVEQAILEFVSVSADRRKQETT